MNKILKKRIEEAADTEMSQYYNDDEYPCGIKDIQSDFKEAFKIGAEYALSHQWISIDEALPEYEEDVLALIGGTPVIAKGYHVRAGLRYNTHWMSIPKFKKSSEQHGVQ